MVNTVHNAITLTWSKLNKALRFMKIKSCDFVHLKHYEGKKVRE